MNRHFAMLALVGLCVGCAAEKASQGEQQTQERVGNLTYFDVGVCYPYVPTVPEHVTSETLLGVMLAVQPQVLECLVSPKARGPEKDTSVILDGTLSDTGVVTQVTGKNLTPDGTQCVQSTLEKWFHQFPTLNAKNAYRPVTKAPSEPITSHLELHHVADVNPTVTMGINEGSDYVGAIRLAEAGWCDCFADWKNAEPHQLGAQFNIQKPKPAPDAKDAKAATTASPSIDFSVTSDPASDRVGACLKSKIAAMQLPAPKGDSFGLQKLPFKLVNSGFSGPLTDASGAPPELQFLQLDLLRTQRNAESAIAAGQQLHGIGAFEAIVQKYKASPNSVPLKDLRDKCAAMVKGDDAFASAMDKVVEVNQQTASLATALKAKDPAWTDAEARAGKVLAEAQSDEAKARQARAQHSAQCAKLHY